MTIIQKGEKMSILIKDMDMPDCCFHCVCSDDGCGITGDVLTTEEMRKRPDWCPLEEVPDLQPTCNQLATDCISRQAAINALENTECELLPEEWDELTDAIMNVPSAQPDYTHMVVGNLKNGITMWYECAKCTEPVTIGDKYCRNCGRKFKNE